MFDDSFRIRREFLDKPELLRARAFFCFLFSSCFLNLLLRARAWLWLRLFNCVVVHISICGYLVGFWVL